MFKQLSVLLAISAIYAMAVPVNHPTEAESTAELQAAGMTQASIDGLSALTHRFAAEFPLVQSNKEATDKFIADYTTDAQNFIKAMPENDQAIYSAYLKKYGLA